VVNKGRVLVVDDHHVNRRLIELWLSKQGYVVEVAVNGQAALECLTSADDYCLVVMDCQMPVMDGLEATRQLRQREVAEQLPRLPVIALTAGGGGLSAEVCKEAGMDAFLLKPVNFSLLEATIFGLQRPRW
jgi:CheY-like chemotaxis protein